jgi:hypothetical protein
MLTYFPVIIISGTLGGISEPHWLSTIATYLPAQPLVHALGSSLAHTPGHALLPGRDLVVLAAWSIAGLAAAVATFRWEPHRPTQQRPARALYQPKPDDQSHAPGSGRRDNASTTLWLESATPSPPSSTMISVGPERLSP